jgi:hypothetical protein
MQPPVYSSLFFVTIKFILIINQKKIRKKKLTPTVFLVISQVYFESDNRSKLCQQHGGAPGFCGNLFLIM